MTSAQKPLSGVKVVEFDAIGPVPLAAMILADLGCDVIRVARPPNSGQTWDEVGGAILHRNRSVVHLNLKNADDRSEVLKLVAGADAVIEGFRPGVMERLGLGPEDCMALNPALVFTRMTGWGQTGPFAQRAGHDINYIGLTGVLNAIGDFDRPPSVPLNLIGDYGGGAMFAVVGLISGIFSARTSGQGAVVDVAMVDGVANLSSMFHAFTAIGLWSAPRASNLLDGSRPFYRCYACADGRYVAVGALEPVFFAQLLAGLGVAPDRFVQDDEAGWPEMTAVFEAAFGSRDRDAWASLFAETDACVTPVLGFEEAPHHPHNRERGVFLKTGDLVQPAPAPRFSTTPVQTPRLGTTAASAEAVLQRWRANP
ncbi:CaiB/BaiF CoA-transferase family protein [soil metagenome]